jgi:hypothetical protein
MEVPLSSLLVVQVFDTEEVTMGQIQAFTLPVENVTRVAHFSMSFQLCPFALSSIDYPGVILPQGSTDNLSLRHQPFLHRSFL